MPVELLGGVRFPQIGELPYLLTLGGYGFYWIRLPAPARPGRRPGGARHERASADDGLPRRGPLVRRQGPRLRRGRRRPRRHPSRTAAGDHRHHHRAVRRRTRGGGADRPSATRCRSRTTPRSRTGSATPTSGRTPTTTLGDVHTYDAVHDREAMAVYLDAFAQTPGNPRCPTAALTFHRVDRATTWTPTSHSTLFSGEQSNSSVAFGDDSLLKVFRKVTPGRNPDIEIHRALTEAENPNVAALYGWIEAGEDDLAMIQQFLRTASDGWDLALAQRRATCSPRPTCTPTRWAATSPARPHRLGAAVAEVHVVLREHFDTEAVDDAADRRGRCAGRLTAAAAAVPQLAEHADALEEVFARIGDAKGEAQRVHGDLHLGQTLRTSLGWKLVDFEGEPAKPAGRAPAPGLALARRRRHAALLRLRRAVGGQGPALRRRPRPQITYRATEWVERNRTAFLDGYVEAESRRRPLTADEWALIDAYEADKAVYEVLYEARNRPALAGHPARGHRTNRSMNDHDRAHDRRDGPPPDQRGASRAAVGRPRRPRRRRRHHLPRLGTGTPWRSRSAATSTAGTAAATRWPRSRTSGVWETFVPGRRLGRRLQVPHPRCRRRLARQGRPDGLLHRGPAGHRLARLRRARHTWTDDEWMTERANGPAPTSSRCRSTRCTSARGASTRVPVPTATTTWSSTSWRTSSRWASRTSSSCPVMEHPFGGSWGYQVTSYYAPTSRFGDPDGFRRLVEALHNAGIGVIVDWVPAHFPKDDFALARFDGTAALRGPQPEPRRAPRLGHLRVQLRAQGGAQLPGRQRAVLARGVPHRRHPRRRRGLDALPRLLARGRRVAAQRPRRTREPRGRGTSSRSSTAPSTSACPGAITIAEESTSWPGVTQPTDADGLGFGFKWNMGWMHDSPGVRRHETRCTAATTTTS